MFLFKKKNNVKGHFEGVAEGCARGWAFKPSHPNHPLTIEILEGNRVIATGQANIFREDMLEHGFGDGYHSFCIPLSAKHDPTLLLARDKLSKTILPPPQRKTSHTQAEPEKPSPPLHEQTKNLIKNGNKEAAINLLKARLRSTPEDPTVISELLKLIGPTTPNENLPGNSQWLECENARTLLELAIEMANNGDSSQGTL